MPANDFTYRGRLTAKGYLTYNNVQVADVKLGEYHKYEKFD